MAVKIRDGYICRNCKRYIPYGTALNFADKDYLEKVYKEKYEKAKMFNTTSMLGDLYLDSGHRLFLVSARQKKGEPLDFGDIYHINELKGLGLTCCNLKNIGSQNRDNIICDIKLLLETHYSSHEYIVVKNKNCSFSYEGNNIKWNEPGEMQVVEHMLFQMAEDETFSIRKQLAEMNNAKEQVNNEILSESQKSEQWARGILFISEEESLTKSLIKSKRNALLKIFHPDNGYKDTKETELVYKAYETLEKIIR